MQGTVAALAARAIGCRGPPLCILAMAGAGVAATALSGKLTAQRPRESSPPPPAPPTPRDVCTSTLAQCARPQACRRTRQRVSPCKRSPVVLPPLPCVVPSGRSGAWLTDTPRPPDTRRLARLALPACRRLASALGSAAPCSLARSPLHLPTPASHTRGIHESTGDPPPPPPPPIKRSTK